VSGDDRPWRRFADPAFAFEFDYPEATASGSAVTLQRYAHEQDERVHVTSEDLEVYFELDRAADRSALGGLRALAEDVRGRFEDSWFGIPETTELCGMPARTVRFRFDRRNSWAIFTEEASVSYRVILDPRSVTNLAILGTLTPSRGEPPAG
jgi:hypothetical protein